jgi:peptidyl-tRNA hydrolase, PTH1 family
MKIIVGLGNPGEKYIRTRHNVGFMVLDEIAKRNDLVWKENKRLNCFTARWNDTTLVKPTTFMNNSGVAAQAVMAYYNLIPKKFKIFQKKDCDLCGSLTIIHDDLDIPFGKIKTATDSRAAGNNGVQSIINHLKTKNFRRTRVGIKNEKLRKVIPAKNFVLMRFDRDEEEKLGGVIDGVIDKV